MQKWGLCMGLDMDFYACKRIEPAVDDIYYKAICELQAYSIEPYEIEEVLKDKKPTFEMNRLLDEYGIKDSLNSFMKTKDLVAFLKKNPGVFAREVMTLRGYSTIHYWIVRNVLGNVDNWQEVNVYVGLTKDQLLALMNDCKKVLVDNSLAEELLPIYPKYNFYSGYGASYLEALKDSMDAIENVVLWVNWDEEVVYYSPY